VSEVYTPVHFGLIVTGKGEREFLPEIFKSLRATHTCTFQIISKTGQRAPITSPKRRLEMVGQHKTIPDLDQSEIGLPSRRFLQAHHRGAVILIDDLEWDYSAQAQEKYNRYRMALDTMLDPCPELKFKVSVHFLVNMLEAYYFADAQALNEYLARFRNEK